MPPIYNTPGRYGVRRLAGSSLASDIDAGFDAGLGDIEGLMATDSQGTLAARPVSSPGTPGKIGRYYYATDTGVLYRDYGTGWTAVNEAELRRKVGSSNNAPFAAGWGAYVNQPGFEAPWYLKHDGMVYMGGLASGGGGAIFALPAGFRPEATLICPIWCGIGGSQGPGRIDVYPDGGVLQRTGPGSEYVSLTGITFRAVN